MNFDIIKSFGSSIVKSYHRSAIVVKKHSPEICMAVGTATAVLSVVAACKATLKVNSVLENTKKTLDDIHQCESNEALKVTGEYTEEDAARDKVIVYTKTAVEFAKLYAPAILLGAASLISFYSAATVLKKRNLALAAAFSAVSDDFKRYRKRVVERFGEEADKELKYGVVTKKEKVTTVDPETGETKEEIVEQKILSQNELYSDYAKVFDETCPDYKNDPEYNLVFIKSVQNYANDILRTRGHLFLNEVYDMFGFKRTRAGQVVGWVYDPTDETRDNYVDFGLYDINKQSSSDFVNGYEKQVILDFNVDGNIWELIG